MTEGEYKTKLKKKLEEKFPGCIILKNDANYKQGIPDLLVLYQEKWAALETKLKGNSPQQPNQEYYVTLMNEMSYAAFVSPDNESEVLNAIQKAFRARRTPRLSKSIKVPLD